MLFRSDTFVHVMMVIDVAAKRGTSLPVRFAALMHDLGKGLTSPDDWPRHIAHEARGEKLADQVCKRLKLPNEVRELALLAAREHGNVARALEMRPETLVKLFERCDAFRKPARFTDLLRASECDHLGRAGFENRPFPQAEHLLTALEAAQAVNAGEIADEVRAKDPVRPAERIAAAIHQARVRSVRQIGRAHV